MLLLHGGLRSSREFEEYIPFFASRYKIIILDRREHGRSFDNQEPYSYLSMADDVNTFLEYLKIDSAYVIGWSDGGVVGYHLASKYPAKVKKLIAVGANIRVGELTKQAHDWIINNLSSDKIDVVSPGIKENFTKLNPNPDNFNNFIDKTKKLWLTDPYILTDDFSKINLPVLLVAGDRDLIKLEDMIEMYSMLNDAQICILPNTDHFIFNKYNEIVAKIIMDFLKP